MVTPENVLERNEGEKCDLWRNAENTRESSEGSKQ